MSMMWERGTPWAACSSWRSASQRSSPSCVSLQSGTSTLLYHRSGINMGLLGSLAHLPDKLFAQNRNTSLFDPGYMFPYENGVKKHPNFRPISAPR